MSFRYARHWARLFNRPLLVEPNAFEAMLPAVERVFRAGVLPENEAFVSVKTELSQESEVRVVGPVAVIPIMGPLYHRGQYTADCMYLSGYEDIAGMIRDAGDDSSVKAIALSIDSPGGEVAGCFDLARGMKEMAQGKPIVAMANDMACSAAYALACGADRIVATETAQVGSIGVLLRHEDYSKYLEKLGVNVTLIHAGKHKVDGNPFQELASDVRKNMQAEIDSLYTLFTELVANSRPIDLAAVRATEARVYMGAAALSAGLVDDIGAPDAVLAKLCMTFSDSDSSKTFLPGASAALTTADGLSSTTKSENIIMSLPEAITAALGLPAEASEAQAVSAIQSLSTASATAERERIIGIIEHPEAEGRTGVAINLAKVVAMTPDSAGAVMKAIPFQQLEVTAEPIADNQFAGMMAKLNPDVGLNDDDSEDSELKQARVGWARAFGTN